ncbi:DMT family transporter [Dactylosporangium sp. NPDC051484]|uniref:DMT family transporter n=1 Tax=Dactylosporangium sp. NPDC051484 TaxID=3154942 RepID=UPI00344CC539
MSAASMGRLGLLGLIWGSVFLWIKLAGQDVSPVQMVFVRLVMGAAALLLIGLAKGLRPPGGWKLWGHLTVAALLGNAVPWVLFAWGERTASSSAAGIINSTTPVWTVLALLALGGGARLGVLRALGLALGAGGTVLVAAPWQQHGANSAGGVIAFTIGTVSLGASFAYMGRFLTGRGVPPLMLAAAQLTAASGLLLLAMPFAGLQPVHLHTDSLISLLVLGVVCTGLAYVLNFELITRDGATVASSVTYLFPVVSVLLGAVVLDEPVGWTVFAGAVAVLAGIFLIRRPAPAAAPQPVPADA